jgi:ATP-dependent DNA helicase RecG
MTAHDDLRALVEAGESARVEFKASLSDTRRIIETIAGMATIGGGVVLVGMRDDGTVVGCNPGRGEVERFVQQVLTGTDPRIYVDLDQPTLDDLPLVRVRVPPGDGPHLAFGRAFFRSGPTTVAMTRDEYERRLLDRLRESAGFESREEPSRGFADLDPASVTRFCGLAAGRLQDSPDPGDPRTLLARLHLASGERLTVAGCLLFAREPQGPLPQAVIRGRALRGLGEDACAVEGTLLAQIDTAVAFVERNLRHRPRRDGPIREDIPELPRAAVREVVANAVAHRDYRSTAPIQLRLDDQALEVWNPGGLPAPLTPASLREPHPSIPPNPFLARALFLAGYIEEWGTGTLRVIEAMRVNGNPTPTFEAGRMDGVRVLLPLPGTTPAGLPTRLLSALAALPAGAPFRSAEYARIAGVSPRTAALDLAAAEAAGLARRVGTGRATRWRKTLG